MGALEEPPQTASIVEELLLALLGHTGDVFEDDQTEEIVAEPTRCTFHVSTDLGVVSYSDRCCIAPMPPNMTAIKLFNTD